MSDLFKYLDLETISTCNRTCPTCIRNSHPNREAVKSWFEPHYLPMDVIRDALDQVAAMGFKGGVCLSHYNEPLMDERIPEIAHLAKSYGQFYPVFLNTNGDFINSELVRYLDNALDRIIITLYMDEPKKSERKEWLESLFAHTEVQVITQSEHIPTHFSPKFPVKQLAEKHIDRTCIEPQLRVIINHRQQYLLCCDDVIGNFDLGTFPEISIKDFWFGKKRTQIMEDLKQRGGRRNYGYCSTCPRG